MQTTSHAPPDEIARKLAAARAQLVIEKPFLGVLVLHLPLTAADPRWCPTTATDARAIYYNPAYIAALSLEQTKCVLAHEALHCALSHFHRRDHRNRRRWDIACDLAVNAILAGDGFALPPNALYRKECAGMSAEEIYPYVREDTDEATLDLHVYADSHAPAGAGGAHGGEGAGASGGAPLPDHGLPAGAGAGGAGRPRPLTPGESERLAIQWKLRLAAAVQQALRAGRLPASAARFVDDLVQPQLPWRMLLARHMTAVARTDYSFARPSRREGSAILPGLRAAQIDVVVVIDTSGSITDAEMREFVTEVNALKGQVNARITLHACDAALAPDGPWTCEPWEQLVLPRQLIGGGGTRFTPAFEWAAQLEPPPDLLIYFTDAEGEFPAAEPPLPVLWLVKGKAPVPWGQRIQLN
ncbi:MAG TPA: VWA-like domain-containing protein [Burkholderiales bacterium]